MTPIQMAAKFHDARDFWKMLKGDQWREDLHHYTAQLRRLMASTGTDEVGAVLMLGKQLRDMGDIEALTPWLAAACEMAEPSPQ